MNPFERITGELQPLLNDDGFNDNNFAEIERTCKRYLENEVTGDPLYARRETGIYLMYYLVSDLRNLWQAEEPLISTRRDALKAGTWGPFRDLARAVLEEADSEALLKTFQKALRAVLVLV